MSAATRNLASASGVPEYEILISMQAAPLIKMFVLRWSTFDYRRSSGFRAMAGDVEVGTVTLRDNRWTAIPWGATPASERGFENPDQAMAFVERGWLSNATLAELRTFASSISRAGDHAVRWSCGPDGMYSATYAGDVVARTKIPGLGARMAYPLFHLIRSLGVSLALPALDLPDALEGAERGWLVQMIRMHAALAMAARNQVIR